MDLEPKMEPKISTLGAVSPSGDRVVSAVAGNSSGPAGVHSGVAPASHYVGAGGPLGHDGVLSASLLGPGPHPGPPPGLGLTRSMLDGGGCGGLPSAVGSLAAADTTSAGAGVNPGVGGALSATTFIGASPGVGSQAGSVQDSPGDRRRHWCVICGDRASGKHYGVFSCEGCKGFFKRTVRKDLTYNCRESRQCVIDRRQRNRCQYCRYEKCLAQGMRREAVQEERMRARERSEQQQQQLADQGLMDTDGGGAGNSLTMPLEQILEAELAVEPENLTYVDVQQDPVTNICHAADKQLFSLVDWSKRLPHFKELSIDDQVNLLKASWHELLIAGFSYRSTVVQDGILLATGLHVHRDAARQAGVGTIFDRILMELVAKMRDLKMDRTELGCLRAIVLFNPDAKGIASRPLVERLREKVYSTLEEYCRTQYPEEPGRFAKLLLRLPALRSLGLKCLEHLFFFKLMGDTPIDTFLTEMLDTGTTMDD